MEVECIFLVSWILEAAILRNYYHLSSFQLPLHSLSIFLHLVLNILYILQLKLFFRLYFRFYRSNKAILETNRSNLKLILS